MSTERRIREKENERIQLDGERGKKTNNENEKKNEMEDKLREETREEKWTGEKWKAMQERRKLDG